MVFIISNNDVVLDRYNDKSPQIEISASRAFLKNVSRLI